MKLIARSCYFTGVGSKRIEAKNMKQKRYQDLLDNRNKPIIFCSGPSGTGKTLLACEQAVRLLDEKRVEKVVLARPAVYVDENHGFLPGSLNEKLAPFFENMMEYFEDRLGFERTMRYFDQEKIVYSPLGTMRGKTFKNSFVIADEMQNSTSNQMKMLLTRVGENTKLVVTGDVGQHDRCTGDNGLKDILDRLRRVEYDTTTGFFSIVEFDVGDVERHPLIRSVLKLYD